MYITNSLGTRYWLVEPIQLSCSCVVVGYSRWAHARGGAQPSSTMTPSSCLCLRPISFWRWDGQSDTSWHRRVRPFSFNFGFVLFTMHPFRTCSQMLLARTVSPAPSSCALFAPPYGSGAQKLDELFMAADLPIMAAAAIHLGACRCWPKAAAAQGGSCWPWQQLCFVYSRREKLVFSLSPSNWKQFVSIGCWAGL